MKKINVKQELMNVAKKPLMRQGEDGVGEVPITLGSILVNSLLDPKTAGEKVNGEAKLMRWNMAQEVYEAEHEGSGFVLLGTSDVSMLKKLIEMIYPPMFSGQAFQMLNDAETAKGEDDGSEAVDTTDV